MSRSVALISLAVAAVISFSSLPVAQGETAVLRDRSAARASKVWRARDVLKEKPDSRHRNKIRWCNGNRFKPCVCWNTSPELIKYRPAVAECGGKAAVFLSGKWMHAYSVVVRDSENRDRYPVQGMNGCTYYERNVLALNKCSAFKTQKRFRVRDGKREADVFCLGASGYSGLFSDVVRITVKLVDIPNSSSDPLMRFCLKSPRDRVN